jgi:hypothetical protein
MYATGASWLGNINHESLSEIAYRFSGNPVVDFFSSTDLAHCNLTEHIYSQKNTPRHPCSLAVKIAEQLELTC